jgi:hypothetical protein
MIAAFIRTPLRLGGNFGSCELTFDAAEFPFAFLQAFGNKEIRIIKLQGKNLSRLA